MGHSRCRPASLIIRIRISLGVVRRNDVVSAMAKVCGNFCNSEAELVDVDLPALIRGQVAFVTVDEVAWAQAAL